MFEQAGNFQNPYMGQQFGGGYPYGYNNGYGYQTVPGGAEPSMKLSNVLTDEEIKSLRQAVSQFSLGLTEKETLRAACNHVDSKTGLHSIVTDPITGVSRCSICGYEFGDIDPHNLNSETVKEITDKVIDILQNIKLMYSDLPDSAVREYFQIIPLIDKIPKLFEFASKNLSKLSGTNTMNYQNGMGAASMFNQFSNSFTNMGMMGQPMMNQPMMNQYAANPQQPVGYPGANPFGYPGASQAQPQFAPIGQQQPMFNNANNANVGGYQPSTVGFNYQPTAQQNTPVQPTITAPGAPKAEDTKAEDVTVTKTVNV